MARSHSLFVRFVRAPKAPVVSSCRRVVVQTAERNREGRLSHEIRMPVSGGQRRAWSSAPQSMTCGHQSGRRRSR